MKWLVASDIHGSAFWCRRLIDAVKQENADRILLLGDLLYHGPRNPLPDGYDPKEVIQLLSGYKEILFCVRGNCDAEVDQMVLPFPILADYALLEHGMHQIVATHGHIYPLQKRLPLAPGTILLYGHTHVPCCKEEEGIRHMNPGSAALPKENSPHSYMTIEEGVFRWKTMDGDTYQTVQL